MKSIRAGIVLVATIGLAQPQGAATVRRPEFEVASVKPIARPIDPSGGPWIVGHGRFKADAAWVRGVIGLAYGVLAVQVRAGPAWIDTDRYDFAAKAATADAGPDEIRAMLQTLLAERFKLAVHSETKDLSSYTLVVGKNGSKLQQAEGRKNIISWVGRGQVVFTEESMVGLVNVLSSTLGSPVVDRTGLTGLYNFKLEFTDPRSLGLEESRGVPANSAPDIFTAVQDQLGLRLEAKKAPVEVLVIDHVERASGN